MEEKCYLFWVQITNSDLEDMLTEDSIHHKKRYLHNMYLKSFDVLNVRMTEITPKMYKADKIASELKVYNEALKKAI